MAEVTDPALVLARWDAGPVCRDGQLMKDPAEADFRVYGLGSWRCVDGALQDGRWRAEGWDGHPEYPRGAVRAG